MAPALSRLVFNALGSLAVLAAVGGMAFGFPAIDEAMPDERAVVDHIPYRISDTVTVVPPARASVDLTRTRPGDNKGTASFVADGVHVVVMVNAYHGSLAKAAERLHDRITNTTGFQVTGADRVIRTGQGVDGLRGAYSSPGRLGEYAVFVADELSVEVTISGPEQRLRTMVWELDACLQSVTFGAPR